MWELIYMNFQKNLKFFLNHFKNVNIFLAIISWHRLVIKVYMNAYNKSIHTYLTNIPLSSWKFQNFFWKFSFAIFFVDPHQREIWKLSLYFFGHSCLYNVAQNICSPLSGKKKKKKKKNQSYEIQQFII